VFYYMFLEFYDVIYDLWCVLWSVFSCLWCDLWSVMCFMMRFMIVYDMFYNLWCVYQKFLEEYSESTQTPENTAPIVEIERPGCNIFSGGMMTYHHKTHHKHHKTHHKHHITHHKKWKQIVYHKKIFSAPFDANKYVPGLSAATDQFIRGLIYFL